MQVRLTTQTEPPPRQKVKSERENRENCRGGSLQCLVRLRDDKQNVEPNVEDEELVSGFP
jgi:hypothetical protein